MNISTNSSPIMGIFFIRKNIAQEGTPPCPARDNLSVETMPIHIISCRQVRKVNRRRKFKPIFQPDERFVI